MGIPLAQIDEAAIVPVSSVPKKLRSAQVNIFEIRNLLRSLFKQPVKYPNMYREELHIPIGELPDSSPAALVQRSSGALYEISIIESSSLENGEVISEIYINLSRKNNKERIRKVEIDAIQKFRFSAINPNNKKVTDWARLKPDPKKPHCMELTIPLSKIIDKEQIHDANGDLKDSVNIILLANELAVV